LFNVLALVEFSLKFVDGISKVTIGFTDEFRILFVEFEVDEEAEESTNGDAYYFWATWN